MKGKHKGNNKHVQRGGDEPLLIKDSAIDNKQMPLPIKRIPYDVKIFHSCV